MLPHAALRLGLIYDPYNFPFMRKRLYFPLIISVGDNFRGALGGSRYYQFCGSASTKTSISGEEYLPKHPLVRNFGELFPEWGDLGIGNFHYKGDKAGELSPCCRPGLRLTSGAVLSEQ